MTESHGSKEKQEVVSHLQPPAEGRFAQQISWIAGLPVATEKPDSRGLSSVERSGFFCDEIEIPGVF
jgi:hypothetical protein